MTDHIKFEVLADGTIKIETDGISPANHKAADELLDFMADLAGGERKRRKRERTPHLHRHGKITHTH